MPPGNNCPSGRGAKAALVERRNGLPLLPMKIRVIFEERTDAVLALTRVGLSGGSVWVRMVGGVSSGAIMVEGSMLDCLGAAYRGMTHSTPAYGHKPLLV